MFRGKILLPVPFTVHLLNSVQTMELDSLYLMN